MRKGVKIGRLTVGTGIPKICVPLTGKNHSELKSQLRTTRKAEPDLVEWRADCFEGVKDQDQVFEALRTIRESLKDIPLLFTFRTIEEGGCCEMRPEQYKELLLAVANTDLIDAVDVELYAPVPHTAELIRQMKEKGKTVVCSNHHFHETPTKDIILSILSEMEKVNADILKIAVMPHDAGDVLTLLSATWEMQQKCDHPLITMAMGGVGAVSRMSGEFFGSAITFASAGASSAPGQLPIFELKKILMSMHTAIDKEIDR